MARASRTTTEGEPLYVVVCSTPAGAVREAWVTTEHQAWELVRTHLVDDGQGHAGTEVGRDFAAAIGDLDDEGPQPYGWWSEVGGTEYWYGPRRVPRPDGVSAGEMALLLAVASAG